MQCYCASGRARHSGRARPRRSVADSHSSARTKCKVLPPGALDPAVGELHEVQEDLALEDITPDAGAIGHLDGVPTEGVLLHETLHYA